MNALIEEMIISHNHFFSLSSETKEEQPAEVVQGDEEKISEINEVEIDNQRRL